MHFLQFMAAGTDWQAGGCVCAGPVQGELK
jgi:hypothetical protein